MFKKNISKQPTPEVYQRELEYLRKEEERTNAFCDLASRFEEPTDDLVDTLHFLHSSAKRGFILNPEKIEKLMTEQPELHNKILSVYMDFLKEKGGF